MSKQIKQTSVCTFGVKHKEDNCAICRAQRQAAGNAPMWTM